MIRANRVVVGTIFLALCLGGYLWSQQVNPGATTLAVQLTPPGAATTLQTFWSFTSTGGAQANTLTQPAQAGKTNYCTGFEVTGAGATGASIVTVTLASGGTTVGNWSVTIPAGATTTITPLIVEFTSPFVGSAPGQNMVLTVPSFGAGNTNASATMHGYSQ